MFAFSKVRSFRLAAFLGWGLCILPFSVSADDKKDERKIPDPRPVSLDTKDGVMLRCMYYEVPDAKDNGKETVPIILVHGWEGRGSEFDALASGLQREFNHAVIVPDLRGHGRSNRRKTAAGEDEDIELDEMKNVDFLAMGFDLKAVKKFLLEEHNAGKLNIELLTVVAADMGALVALNWAAAEWSIADLPAYRRGKDVKALFLLSPPQSFKGLNSNVALRNPYLASHMSMMIVVGGDDRKATSDARRLYKKFEQKRPKPDKDDDDYVEKNNLFWAPIPNTSLQGVGLLSTQLPVNRYIAEFIKRRIVDRADKFLEWAPRKYE